MTMEAKRRPTHEYEDTEKIKTCRFYVEGNEKLALAKIAHRTASTVVVKTTENTATIECAKGVFYPITVCYLMTQSGEVLFSEDYESLASGNCDLEVTPGDWTCAFNGPTEEDLDFFQKFEVVPVDKVVGGLVEAFYGDTTVTMKCHLFHKNPIKVCMFVSPSGKVFRPPSDHFKSEEFSYHKEGRWEEGQCDISLGEDVKLSMKFHVPKRGKFGNYAFFEET